jgi:hypothetical protein
MRAKPEPGQQSALQQGGRAGPMRAPDPIVRVSLRRARAKCGIICGMSLPRYLGNVDRISITRCKWRRGWDSNPRYACTHNGFRDRPDRPLWHLSGAPLIGGRFCPGNSAVGGADIPLFSLESGVSGVDLGGFLRIFRPPPAGHSGPPCSFVLSGIWGRGPANSLGMVGSAQPEGF